MFMFTIHKIQLMFKIEQIKGVDGNLVSEQKNTPIAHKSEGPCWLSSFPGLLLQLEYIIKVSHVLMNESIILISCFYLADILLTD